MANNKEGIIILRNVRLSYPKLHEATSIKGDATSKPRYSANLLIRKDDDEAQALIKQEVKRLVKLHYKGVMPKSKNLPYTDGDGEDGDEFSTGCVVISANRAGSQGKPTIIDGQKNLIQAGDEKDPYAGCYVNVKIGIYKPKNWDRICASLETVQFAKHGEPFGAGKPSADDMPDIEDDLDDSGLDDDGDEDC
jgi:hypothetical protein